jgi:hypothetical protein
MTKTYTKQEALDLLTKLAAGDRATTNAFIAECMAEVWADVAAERAQQDAMGFVNSGVAAAYDRALDKIQDGYLGKDKPTGWPATTLYPDGWGEVEGGEGNS